MKERRREKREGKERVICRGGRETRTGTKKGMSGKIKISKRRPGGEVLKRRKKETEGKKRGASGEER